MRKDGILEGEQLGYDANEYYKNYRRQLVLKRYYTNGILNGKESYWDMNGILLSTVEYENGLAHGIAFDYEDKDEAVVLYENGNIYYSLDKNEKLTACYLYDDGDNYKVTDWRRDVSGALT